MKIVEHMDNIIILSGQIEAILDLMQMTGDNVDVRSIKIASEMLMTMHGELMKEVFGIEKITKEGPEQV